MPIDPQIIPSLKEALGAGYEAVFEALRNEGTVSAGAKPAAAPKAKPAQTKSKAKSRSRKMRGGSLGRTSASQGYEYDMDSGSIKYLGGGKTKSRRRRSRSRSRRSHSKGRKLSGGQRTWIEHVRLTAGEHNVSWKEAMTLASQTWKTA